MAKYKTGDRVEYRPVGGAHDNVSHTVGEICEVVDAVKGDAPRYVIRNDSTNKETTYQEMYCEEGLNACAF